MQSGNLADGGVNTEYPWLRKQRLDATASTGQVSDRAGFNDDASDVLGIRAATPIPSLHSRQQQQQQQVVVGTPDSMVLDRMLELESVIATVKSSLDNHASSYYSVASQIAE
ncbi:hypothetical protein H4S07_000699 [Coemansia furcata]|uniref:Uncharacterized protein n=1 Tax=Coemansia furcata TaxID=417177 RepID=A0ACC1LQE1_9FUNG|nr:hypothetical protein H4S07_000699 [Coemansia furcata]